MGVVGTIVGFVVFFPVLANAASEACGDTETTVTQPADKEAAMADEEESADAAEQGTRENPYPHAPRSAPTTGPSS